MAVAASRGKLLVAVIGAAGLVFAAFFTGTSGIVQSVINSHAAAKPQPQTTLFQAPPNIVVSPTIPVTVNNNISTDRPPAQTDTPVPKNTVRQARHKDLLSETTTPPPQDSGFQNNQGNLRPEIAPQPSRPALRPASRPEIISFHYHFISRGEGSEKGLIGFDWTVGPLPEGDCKYSLYVGNTAVGSGNQFNRAMRTQAPFLSHLAQEAKTLKVFCGGKQDEAQGIPDTPGTQ